MTEERVCLSPEIAAKGSVLSVPFNEIPGQSELFILYQTDPASLAEFYPNAVKNVDELSAYAPRVLDNYTTDREEVCDALERLNRDIGTDAAGMMSIERLRASNTVAVLTGQQAGLFTGPLYTIYKALSAVELARELTDKGTPAVPIFWAATEDHDLDEAAAAAVIAVDGKERHFVYTPKDRVKGGPVGSVVVDEGIDELIDELFGEIKATQFSDEAKALVSQSWKAGAGFGTAFLRQIAKVLSGTGLIFVDPTDAGLRRLASPVIGAAIEHSAEIESALIRRSDELIERGFHAQVLVEKGHFPMFRMTDDGIRSVLRRDGENFVSRSDRKVFSKGELLEMSASEPERFSPGVMLRPVVQDHLFPTVCYFGGGAEIAYFAQNSEVYRILDRPVTPILHRQSFTIVPARHQRTMAKYGVEFTDIFGGADGLIDRVGNEKIGRETAKVFADAEEMINTQLNRLDRSVGEIDVTLLDGLAKRRRKMLYHIAAMKKKAIAAQVRNTDDAGRRLIALVNELYPDGHLQERSVNILTYLNEIGPGVIEVIFDSIDLDDRGHRVIFL